MQHQTRLYVGNHLHDKLRRWTQRKVVRQSQPNTSSTPDTSSPNTTCAAATSSHTGIPGDMQDEEWDHRWPCLWVLVRCQLRLWRLQHQTWLHE